MSETLNAASVTVTIASCHLRRDASLVTRTPRAIDSGGNAYSYRKGPATRALVLAWPVTAAELDDLLTFVRQTAQGSRVLVTWTDADATARTVRLTGGETWQQTGPDRYLIEIPAEEVAA